MYVCIYVQYNIYIYTYTYIYICTCKYRKRIIATRRLHRSDPRHLSRPSPAVSPRLSESRANGWRMD